MKKEVSLTDSVLSLYHLTDTVVPGLQMSKLSLRDLVTHTSYTV
jgi:hypothetical protein